MLVGIDTSTEYQPALKASLVKAEGVDFHMVKASQGTYFGDPWREDVRTRIATGQAAGTIMGAYHFLTRVKDANDDEVTWNTGDKQCDYFIDHLPNKSPEGILCAVDVEQNPNAKSFVRNGKTYHPEEYGRRWVEVKAFVNRWFQRFPNHPLFIYSNKAQWAALCEGKDVKALKPGLLYCWNAVFYGGALKPRYGRDWSDAAINAMAGAMADPWKPKWGGFTRSDIWQVGLLDIKGYKKVDGDAIKYLSAAQLTALTLSAAVVPPTQDRTLYRSGYNAVVTATKVAAAALTLSAGTDYNSGVTTAKADVADTLDDLFLEDDGDAET